MLDESRYFCKNCNTTVETELDYFKIFDNCPFCEVYAKEYVSKIPDYETPTRFEKRKGKPYPDNGLVWAKFDSPYSSPWHITQYALYKVGADQWMIVIADPPVPPPDNWKPKEIENEKRN